MDGRVAWGNDNAPQIVIVDSDAVARRGLLMLLKSHGFEVKAYALGKSLLADLNARAARLLITESHMPDYDGVGLLRAFGDTGWYGASLMLGRGDAGELRPWALAGGFDEFLSLPCREHALMLAIAGLLPSAPASPSSRL